MMCPHCSVKLWDIEIMQGICLSCGNEIRRRGKRGINNICGEINDR